MWEVVIWGAWAISAVLILWMFWDFMSVNKRYSDEMLISSREGVDELFVAAGNTKED